MGKGRVPGGSLLGSAPQSIFPCVCGGGSGGAQGARVVQQPRFKLEQCAQEYEGGAGFAWLGSGQNGSPICPDPIILLHLFDAVGTAKEHTLINKAVGEWKGGFLPIPFTLCIVSLTFAPTTPNLSGLKQRSCIPCSQLVQVGWLVALGPEELGPGWLHLHVQWPVLLWMGDEAAGCRPLTC